jgi:hypothetical protein
MAQGTTLDDPNLQQKLSKSSELQKIDFEASVERSVQSVFKADDEFVIWGPASVELVDKEGDKISAKALDEALPQLLQRARLSLEHSDQIVGRILERFETDASVAVEINGQKYKRSEFPTGVLDLDDGQPPALYVAGEVFNDTEQSKRARERIENGDLTSYSISGEALVTRKKVDDGEVYDDIVDMDLSAVTLCEEGMNQGAKYARIDGNVNDKELAGEATSKNDVPQLEHPTAETVTPSPGSSGGSGNVEAVSKTMSNSSDGENKSEGEATIEDVLKRLPEKGEIATTSDLDEVQEKAVEAVHNSLPDGDLATVSAMEQMIDQKTAGKEDDDMSDDDEAEEEPVDEVDADEIEDPDDDGEDEVDVVEDSLDEKSASVRSARDKLANELGVETEKVNAALTDLLEAGDYEDDEDEMDDEEMDDGYEEDKGEDEMPVDDEDEEMGDDEMPEDDEDEMGDDDEYKDVIERLEDELPADVWEVVREYVKTDVNKSEEPVSPADILKDGPSAADTGIETGASGGESDELEKSVEEVLKGGGAQVGGASASPKAPSEDQVEKQYSEPDDDKETEGSPALEAFYPGENR